jgi:hypothetical protein
LRDGIEDLVRSLAAIPDVDLAMTTNGAHLATKAADLATAGTVHTCLFSSAGTGLRTSLRAGTLHWIRSSQIAPTESSTRFVVIGPAHLIPPQSISINNADTEQKAGLPADRAESLVQNAIGYALGSSGCLSDSVVDSTSNACRRTPDSAMCSLTRSFDTPVWAGDRVPHGDHQRDEHRRQHQHHDCDRANKCHVFTPRSLARRRRTAPPLSGATRTPVAMTAAFWAHEPSPSRVAIASDEALDCYLERLSTRTVCPRRSRWAC